MATTIDLLARAMAKEMAQFTKTRKGRNEIQDFLHENYPQFKARHILMVVNYNELRK